MGKEQLMSDFMMSPVQSLLGKVAEDIDKMSKSTSAQGEMLLAFDKKQ